MEIRCAKPQDVDAIASLEAACFPQAEAATRKSIADRVKAIPITFPSVGRGSAGFLCERTGDGSPGSHRRNV